MPRDPAESFRALHRRGDPLRLLNPWDGASARVFEDAGAPALGTTSAGISFSLGLPDGEALSREQAITAVSLIASRVKLPVSADIESGYGETSADVAETVRMVIAAGAVGINIEDAGGGCGAPLRSVTQAAERIAAARDAADREGISLFINARTDVFLVGGDSDAVLIERALERFRAYASAGADGAFAPGGAGDATITALVEGTDLPLNVLASPAGPPVERLAELGVARVSTGSVPSRATLGLAHALAKEYLESGTLDAAAGMLGYEQLNELFRG